MMNGKPVPNAEIEVEYLNKKAFKGAFNDDAPVTILVEKVLQWDLQPMKTENSPSPSHGQVGGASLHLWKVTNRRNGSRSWRGNLHEG